MKNLLASLGFTILGSLQLLGCMSETAVDCLPGDIDCAPVGEDGRADGFDDYTNNPSHMAKMLTYKLADLPKTGKLTTPTWKDEYPEAVGRIPVAWSDTYWATASGSHNARWQDDSIKSPLEKYDQVFNKVAGCDTQPSALCGPGAKAEWDTYYACAGPAAKWQDQNLVSAMHNGIDDNNDGEVDECYGHDGSDGVARWWGTCHAWTPASLLIPEPQHAVVMNGVTFEVGDIKALTQNVFDRTSSIMLGGRCNAKEITHDVNGSANDACSDVNPGAFHVVLTNFLGIGQLPLIEDRTANYEVWNQPVVGYEVTKQVVITKTDANTCVGQTGDTWKYNAEADELYEVRVTVHYITESSADTKPVGFEHNTYTDDYHYILETGTTGKVIGGRFCTDSTNRHVDFLWSPLGPHHSSNPNVTAENVAELIAQAIKPE